MDKWVKIENKTTNEFILEIQWCKTDKDCINGKLHLDHVDSGDIFEGEFKFDQEIDESCLDVLKENQFKFNFETKKLTFQKSFFSFVLVQRESTDLKKELIKTRQEVRNLKREVVNLTDKLDSLSKSNSKGSGSKEERVITKITKDWSYQSTEKSKYSPIPDFTVEFSCKDAIVICTANGHINCKSADGHVLSTFILDGNSIYQKHENGYYNGCHYLNRNTYGCWGSFCLNQSFAVKEGEHTMELMYWAHETFTLNGGAVQITIIEN